MGWIVLALMTLALFGFSAGHAAEVDKAAGKPDGTGKLAGESAGAPGPGMATPWWSIESWPSLGALGVNSWADMFHRGLWSGSLETSFDQQQQQIRAPNSAEQKFMSRLTSEGVSIRNEGFSLVDPRLLMGNLGLRFSLQQNRQVASGSKVEQQGVLTDYNFDATLLGEKPYNATVTANRIQSQNTNSSGGTTQIANENRSVTLRLREDSLLRDKEILPWFSANLRAAQENSHEVTQVNGQSFRRDDQRTVFNMDAHNGFETADLDFRYEYSDFVNLIYSPGNYRSQLASLGYSLDFGPTLNRRWDSRVNFAERDGSALLSTISVDEALSVEHYANLASAYSYQFTQQKTPYGIVTVQSGGMNVQHRLYANLSTTLGLSGSRQVLPNGQRDSKGAQLNFSYNHGLPWNGGLSTSLGGSYQISNNQLQSGFVAVVGSPFQAPPALGAGAGFLLNDRFIVTESLSVVDIKGGARIPATAGVDYLVVAEGDRTRILLQSSAIIQPGDLLEVSYIFKLDPSIKYQSTSRSASLGTDWRWIGVSVSHDESAQKPLSGGDSSFLTNTTRDTARLNLQGAWENMQAHGDATLTRYNDGKLVYDESRFTQYLFYQPTVNLNLSLSANQYHIDYLSPQRQSQGRSVYLSADWMAPGGWFATASLSRRELEDTQVPSETISEARLRLRRNWSRLDLAVVFGLAERVRGSVQSLNANVHVAAVRRF